MKPYLVTSYAHDWRTGKLSERCVLAKTQAIAEDLADAQYLGGEELVKITDPKGETVIHRYREEENRVQEVS